MHGRVHELRPQHTSPQCARNRWVIGHGIPHTRCAAQCSACAAAASSPPRLHLPNAGMSCAGSEQALCCLPKHMPPESASAADFGARRAPASAAGDMWAVGIIAYELFTRQPAFPGAYPCSFSSSLHACAHSTRSAPSATQQQRTRDQLLGRAPLPWERGAPGVAARLACMGEFGDGVLACLSRDPQRRISAEQLLGRWHRACLARFRRR